MHDQDLNNPVQLEHILSKLKILEERISVVEGKIIAGQYQETAGITLPEQEERPESITAEPEVSMESRIGGYGLALLGNIVLLFGIVLITNYIRAAGFSLYSSIFGVFSVAATVFLSHAIRKSVPHMSKMFRFIGHVLLFYVVLMLHFFNQDPVITNKAIAIPLLLGVVIYNAYYSIRIKSEFYAVVTLVMILTVAVIAKNTQLLFALTTCAAIGSFLLLYKYQWKTVLLLSLFTTYMMFVYWIFSDKSVFNGNTTHFHHFSHFYLLGIAGVFSLVTLLPENNAISKNFIFISVFLNGIIFSSLLALFVFLFFSTEYTGLFLCISAYCIVFSIILKKYSPWIFSPALYALYGFVSLSTAIFGYAGLPDSYLFLSAQSLLVVSMALWFRSKIIVTMNSVLFVLLILAYFSSKEFINSANFSFAFVALITARIINWKKERLEIKTEMLRNIYLISAFGLLLFALYKAVPDKYITLSWIISAVLYFLLSLVLKNVKYRWMAIFTMLASAIYLLLFDLSNISIVYRIGAFMFLAVISIAISLYYTKRKNKDDETPEIETKEETKPE